MKPDGTPFHYDIVYYLLWMDWITYNDGILRSLIDRSGADVTYYDPNADLQLQIDTVQNIVTQGTSDFIFIDAISETMLGPVVDDAWEAGIPVIAFDFPIYSDHVTPRVSHWFDGPHGTNVVGDYYVDIAEARNEELQIFEVWGMRQDTMQQARHNGFHSAVDQSPLITVIESADSNYATETVQDLVMDAFTLHPEYDGIFIQDGGCAGAVEALRVLNRLLPKDDPDHVIIAVNDMESPIVYGIEDGTVDACGTHSPWDLTDVTFKLMLNYSVLGLPMPAFTNVPMELLTAENLYDLRLLGGPAAYPFMPEDFDLWPVLDTYNNVVLDENGDRVQIPTCTPALRKELMGY